MLIAWQKAEKAGHAAQASCSSWAGVGYSVDTTTDGGSRKEANMALKLTRKRDQQLLLSVAPGTTAEQLFEQLNAGIMIQVCFIDGQAVTLGVTAPNCLNIIRPEKHSVEDWEGRPKARQPLWRRLLLGLRAPAAGR